MVVERTDPPYSGAERPMLEAWLDYQRDTLMMKCDGLSAEHLRERAVPPSSMSLLGLVRHMAEVELNWFQRVLPRAKVSPIYVSRESPDADFDDVDGADPDEAFATWRRQVEIARETGAKYDLDDTGTWRWTDDEISLRWIYIHMIEEYARHNGHADFLRERIDGVTGD